MNSDSAFMFRRFTRPSEAVPSLPAGIPPSDFSSTELGERQTIDIYRAVLRRLFGVHDKSTGKLSKPFLFILYAGSNSSADSSAGHPVLSETIREGIVCGSGDLPLGIVWVEDSFGVGRDPAGEYVPSEGAVVRFAGIRNGEINLALVEGSFHRWGLSTCRFEYIVEKKSGFWMVKSTYHKWICSSM